MKALKTIIFTALFCIIFSVSVKAQTYQSNELNKGDFLRTGDIIEKCYNSSYDNYSYNGVKISKIIDYNGDEANISSCVTLMGDLVAVPSDCYVNGIVVNNNELFIVLGEYALMDKDKTITVNEGETVTLTTNIVGFDTNIYEFKWYQYRGTELTNGWTPNLSSYTLENVTLSMNGNQYYYAVKGGTKSCLIDTPHYKPGSLSLEKVTLHVIAKEKPETKEPESESKSESKPESKPEIPEVKSELPYGTVMCGNGGKGNGGKDAVGIKVLKPEQRDTDNQIMFANAYFNKNVTKVFSYNVYPPYGVNASYKNAVKTLYWKDTGLKQGDEVYAIWYCQSSKKGVQVIKCDIDENGVVSIRIPQLGETSVITLVKVN